MYINEAFHTELLETINSIAMKGMQTGIMRAFASKRFDLTMMHAVFTAMLSRAQCLAERVQLCSNGNTFQHNWRIVPPNC